MACAVTETTSHRDMRSNGLVQSGTRGGLDDAKRGDFPSTLDGVHTIHVVHDCRGQACIVSFPPPLFTVCRCYIPRPHFKLRPAPTTHTLCLAPVSQPKLHFRGLLVLHAGPEPRRVPGAHWDLTQGSRGPSSSRQHGGRLASNSRHRSSSPASAASGCLRLLSVSLLRPSILPHAHRTCPRVCIDTFDTRIRACWRMLVSVVCVQRV